MEKQKQKLVHGTAVALEAREFPLSAVLLRGFSGAGKSDLALRLMGLGGVLICDDQVALEQRGEDVTATSVEAIRGLLEVRGVGLVKCPVSPSAPLRLVVDLVAREEVPRLPEQETEDMLGAPVMRLKLHAFDASTPVKIIKAIELAHKPGLLV